MVVSSTVVKNNFGKYLDMAQHEDVQITRNGHTVAVLVSIEHKRASIVDSLLGIIPENIDEKAIKNQRRLNK